MPAFLIFVIVVVGVVVALTTRQGRTDDRGEKMSVLQVIAIAIALVVGALGLLVVGSAILFTLAMSSYGSNK